MKRFPDVPKFPLPAGTKRGDNSIPAAEVEDRALDDAMIALGDRRRAKAAAKAAPAREAAEQRSAAGHSVPAAVAGTRRR